MLDKIEANLAIIEDYSLPNFNNNDLSKDLKLENKYI